MLALLGIVLAFALLAVLIYKQVEFGFAILGATAVLLAFSNPSVEAFRWVSTISIEYETLRLVSIILLIAFLGFIYRDSGQVKRLIKELRTALPDRRAVIASIPALFGLMPMPGGALVSAPMIDEEGDELGVDNIHKAFLNWWFRHIWFAVYPLGLGLILAGTISGLSIYMIALFNLPIFAVHISAGVVWGLGDIEVQNKGDEGIRVNPLLIIWELSPIILALLLNILLDIPLYFSLVVSIIFIILQNYEKYELDDLPRIGREGFSVNLLLASFGIMLFKGTIERSGVLPPVVNTLGEHIPILGVVIIGAFCVGLLLGHMPAAVGIGFPVLLPLLPVINLQTVALVYLIILLGYLISPLHLCIILTVEYFDADLRDFYHRARMAVLVIGIATFLWLFITGSFFFF